MSATGRWMQQIGQSWLVYELTGSGVALGTVTALQFLPLLVLGAWGGVVTDRLDKRRLLMATQSTAGVLALVLGLLVALDVVVLAHVYALAFLLGLVNAVDNPARRSFVSEMVPADDVSNAVSLNSAVMTTSRMVGPAVAGGVILVAGLSVTFFVNAASFLAVIAALWAMDPRELRRHPPAPRAPGQVREGMRYAASRPVLRETLVVSAVVGTLSFNYTVVLPLVADEVFGGGPGVFGLLMAVLSMGSVVGALVTANRPEATRRWQAGAAGAFGLALLAAAAAPTLPIELLVLPAVGAAGTSFAATSNSLLQIHADDQMRGRVLALYSVVFLGSRPIGGPVVGWFAEVFGARAGFLVGAAAALVAGAVAALLVRRVAPAAAPAADLDEDAATDAAAAGTARAEADAATPTTPAAGADTGADTDGDTDGDGGRAPDRAAPRGADR